LQGGFGLPAFCRGLNSSDFNCVLRDFIDNKPATDHEAKAARSSPYLGLAIGVNRQVEHGDVQYAGLPASRRDAHDVMKPVRQNLLGESRLPAKRRTAMHRLKEISKLITLQRGHMAIAPRAET
jgi:hypothetical protein